MNRSSTLTVVLVSCWLCVGRALAASAEVEKARQHGANGQITLRVTDSTGKPVEKAELSVAFWGSDSSADVVVSEGTTDTNGLFVATGKTIDSMNYTITRDGHYKTRGKYWFYRPSGLDPSKSWAVSPTSREYWQYHQGENSVKDGRWQPWNPTNTVVLKEIRNPIPMHAKRVDSPAPVQSAPAGYDLEVGDWVVPSGQGKQSDMLIAYDAEIESPLVFSNQLVITISNKGGGFIRVNKEEWSSFPSVFEAPASGYQSQVVFSLHRTRERILKKEQLSESDYLIFRVRTVLDNEGNIVSARYGKIYGPVEYGEEEQGGGGVRFIYYLNPTANDRNLEFDPSRNLMPNPGRTPVNIP
jgi:hypothetical protein